MDKFHLLPSYCLLLTLLVVALPTILAFRSTISPSNPTVADTCHIAFSRFDKVVTLSGSMMNNPPVARENPLCKKGVWILDGALGKKAQFACSADGSGAS